MSSTQEQVIAACLNGNVEDLSALLKNLDTTAYHSDDLFKKMLQIAAASRQLSVVQHLLPQKPDSFTIDRDLAFAVAIGSSKDIYQAFYSFDPNFISIHFGHTGDAITVAVSDKNISVLTFLLDKGLDPNAGRFLSRWSPIAQAAIYSSREVILLLIRRGAVASGSNALQNAVEYDRLDSVEALLDAGVDVNDAPDYNHIPRMFDHLETPLHTAARCDNLRIMKKLLDRGADPTLRDSEGKTAIMRAHKAGRAVLHKAFQ